MQSSQTSTATLPQSGRSSDAPPSPASTPGPFWCPDCRKRVYLYHSGCWHCGGPVVHYQQREREIERRRAIRQAGAEARAAGRQTFSQDSPDPGPRAMD